MVYQMIKLPLFTVIVRITSGLGLPIQEYIGKIIYTSEIKPHFLPILYFRNLKLIIKPVGIIIPSCRIYIRNKIIIHSEEWIRNQHHNRSREYIENHWEALKLNSYEEASYIGIICQAHRGNDLGSDDRTRGRRPFRMPPRSRHERPFPSRAPAPPDG